MNSGLLAHTTINTAYLLILITASFLQPQITRASTTSIINLSSATVTPYAASLNFEHRNQYSTAQLFLLSRELAKGTDIAKVKAVLNRLEQTADWSVKPIVPIERIKVFLKKSDHARLLNFLVNLAASPEKLLFEETIYTTLIENYTNSVETGKIQKAITQILPRVEKWREDPELISWMLKFIKSGDALHPLLISHLWAAADIEHMPESLIQFSTSVKKNVREHQQIIASHFSTQYRLKNWSYIIKEAPLFLSRMDPDSEGFRKTRRIFIRSFFRKRQYQKLIDLINRPKHKRPFALPAEKQAALLFQLWLKKGYISEARKQLVWLEKSPVRDMLGNRYFELAEFFFNRNRFKESLAHYSKISVENAPESLFPIVQWRKFWANHKLNNTRELKKVANWAATHRFKSREVAAKFCYWAIKLKLNPHRRALSCYQEYPLTYYGFRSLRLGNSYAGIENTMMPA